MNETKNASVAVEAEAFYDSKYTERLNRMKSTIRLRRTFLFEPHLTDADRVLDFGCGPGDLLETLPGKEKFGVEISDTSRQIAASKGIKVAADLKEFEGEKLDKIISSHALEHVLDPSAKLMQMSNLLTDDGRLILLLPLNEWVNSIERKWKPADPNMHLYTWTPLLIGNLLSVSGFQPLSIRTIHHFHPPKIGNFLAKTSAGLYHAAAAVSSRLLRKRQLLAIAKPVR